MSFPPAGGAAARGGPRAVRPPTRTGVRKIGDSDMVFYLPSAQATVVVMVNAADGNAVPSQALWGQIVKRLYPTSLPSW